MSIIFPGNFIVHFPITIFMIYEENDSNFISEWYHVGVKLYHKASH